MIRAALGEVEDYQRVTVRGVEPATIVGTAAADLAHLLAELIENALVFSPPDQTVDIRGRTRVPRAAVGAEGMARAGVGAGDVSGYTLAVIDSGLGMPPADIEAANRRLAGAESFTIAPSKYLGHYVAGNLAARHGIGVRLDASPGNGITATVNIPPALLTTEPVAGAPVMPPDDGRELPAPRGRRLLRSRPGWRPLAGAAVGATAQADGAEEAAIRGGPGTTGRRPPAAGRHPSACRRARRHRSPLRAEPRAGSSSALAHGAAPADATGPGARRRTGAGRSAEAGQRPPGAGPSGDLLAALRRHSANLHGIPGMAGQPPYARRPRPAAAAVPPGRSPRRSRRPSGRRPASTPLPAA